MSGAITEVEVHAAWQGKITEDLERLYYRSLAMRKTLMM